MKLLLWPILLYWHHSSNSILMKIFFSCYKNENESVVSKILCISIPCSFHLWPRFVWALLHKTISYLIVSSDWKLSINDEVLWGNQLDIPQSQSTKQYCSTKSNDQLPVKEKKILSLLFLPRDKRFESNTKDTAA